MKREFVIDRQGKEYVLYAGLLDVAHAQGLSSIKTQLLQAPSAQNGNVAICSAEVTTEKGTFTGLGDADPTNVNRMMANALIRMAETRAKARALRDAVNVAMAALEELTEDSAELGAESPPEGAVSRGDGGATSRIVSLDSVRQHAPPSSPAPAVRAIREERSTPPRISAANGTAKPSVTKPASDSPPAPATPTQLETIGKLAHMVGREVQTERLTRAAASELIARLSEERYGARRTP
jgi:hypothetical protein